MDPPPTHNMVPLLIKHSLANAKILRGLLKYEPDSILDEYRHLRNLRTELAGFLAQLQRERIKQSENLTLVQEAVANTEQFGLKAEGAQAAVRGRIEDQRRQLEGFLRDTEDQVTRPIREKIERTLRRIRERIVAALAERPLPLALIVKTQFLTEEDSVKVVALPEPDPETAVLALALFTRKIPSRYEFFKDDEKLFLNAAGLSQWFDDEGVAEEEVRTFAGEEAVIDAADRDPLPLKTFIPIHLPDVPFPKFRIQYHPGTCDLEVRNRPDGVYTNMIPPSDLALLLGYFMNLNAAGRISLQTQMD